MKLKIAAGALAATSLIVISTRVWLTLFEVNNYNQAGGYTKALPCDPSTEPPPWVRRLYEERILGREADNNRRAGK